MSRKLYESILGDYVVHWVTKEEVLGVYAEVAGLNKTEGVLKLTEAFLSADYCSHVKMSPRQRLKLTFSG